MSNKTLIRQQMIEQRSCLKPSFMSMAEDAIVEQLMFLDIVEQAKNIACYVALDKEVETSLLLDQLEDHAKQVFLPAVRNDDLFFLPYYGKDCLVTGQYGIKEPVGVEQAASTVEELDVMLLPLVAFDKQCHRLGRGAGYYDKVLAHCFKNNNLPVLIGLAYEFQKVDELPVDTWDIALDYIITEETMYAGRIAYEKNKRVS